MHTLRGMWTLLVNGGVRTASVRGTLSRLHTRTSLPFPLLHTLTTSILLVDVSAAPHPTPNHPASRHLTLAPPPVLERGRPANILVRYSVIQVHVRLVLLHLVFPVTAEKK